MKESAQILKRSSEHGGAGVKLLIAGAILILIANAGFNFVPVAYQSESFKADMQTAVIKGISMPSTYGEPIGLVREKIVSAANVNNIPADAFVDVKENNKVITARVYYVTEIPIIPFGVWDYEWVFDHTATPGGFLTESD